MPIKEERIYFDDQGGGQMKIVTEDVSPCLLLNAAKKHALIVYEKKPTRRGEKKSEARSSLWNKKGPPKVISFSPRHIWDQLGYNVNRCILSTDYKMQVGVIIRRKRGCR